MNLINRPHYLNQLQTFRNFDEIKILSGVRGVGKSSLLDIFAQNLLTEGIERENIIRINFDELDFLKVTDEKSFYEILAAQFINGEKKFLLLDEIFRIKNWHAAINRLKKKFDADIYLTTSIDDATEKFLSSPPIILKILPLSFKEFQIFVKFSEEINLQERFKNYLRVGGMPAAVLSREEESAALLNCFSASMIRDVLGGSKITDFELLNELAKKLCGNIGAVYSFNALGKSLGEKAPAVRTVENYVNRMVRANLFHSLPITDIKNSRPLYRYAKYFPADLGIGNFLSGEQNFSRGVLENIIYFELLRIGVKISACRVDKNIVFQVDREDTGDRIYINVAEDLSTEDKKNFAFAPLRGIKNLFAKWVITADENVATSHDGIKVTNILDFLMS